MPGYSFVDDTPKTGGYSFVDPAPDPTDGQSFGTNLLQGIGGAMDGMYKGTMQRLREAGAAGDAILPGQGLRKQIAGYLGVPTPQQSLTDINAQVDEKKKLDAPLLATAGGRTGDILTKMAPAVASAFIPGGQGLAGSAIAGTVLGALDPTATGESAAKNALIGGLGGVAGYGVGKGIGMGVNALAARSQAKAMQNSLVDAGTASARDAGYVIPPSQSNPSSLIANTLDIVAGGRPKMAQAASLKNQFTTNALAADAVGLPAGEPITPALLNNVRSAAYTKGYSPIANQGTITPGTAYSDALDNIVSTTKGASNSFPGAVKNDIPKLIDGLRVNQFDAGDAVKMTQVLRDQANAAYASGNSALGKANKQAAGAIEDAIDAHLSSNGATDALQNFRDARATMAKTYSIGKALNETTGNVSALKMGQQLAAGKPLSDQLLSIGQMGQLSPKNVQTMAYATPGASQLETAGATGAAMSTGNPLLLGVPYARAALRNTLLSKPVQGMMPAPSYGMFQGMTPQVGANLNQFLQRSGASSGMLLPGLLNIGQE